MPSDVIRCGASARGTDADEVCGIRMGHRYLSGGLQHPTNGVCCEAPRLQVLSLSFDFAKFRCSSLLMVEPRTASLYDCWWWSGTHMRTKKTSYKAAWSATIPGLPDTQHGSASGYENVIQLSEYKAAIVAGSRRSVFADRSSCTSTSSCGYQLELCFEPFDTMQGRERAVAQIMSVESYQSARGPGPALHCNRRGGDLLWHFQVSAADAWLSFRFRVSCTAMISKRLLQNVQGAVMLLFLLQQA